MGLMGIVESIIKFNAKYFWEGVRFYLYNYWITNFPNYQLRICYLRNVLGIKIGRGTYIHMGCYFEGNNTTIGRNSVIGRNCYLGGSGGKLIIKDNVSITAQTYIICSTHIKDSPTFAGANKDVTIHDRVWIGARSMILPGVVINEGAILGAASVATKDVPKYTVYAGSPAKSIGKRKRNLSYVLNYYPYFQ